MRIRFDVMDAIEPEYSSVANSERDAPLVSFDEDSPRISNSYQRATEGQSCALATGLAPGPTE